MKRKSPGWLMGISTALVAGACIHAWADAGKNPYETIVDRNPFGLKPPPPPVEAGPPPAPPAPPATVELTGITTMFSTKRALLEIVPGPGKQMIKPILTEGERIESIEVVSINVEKNEVTIKNGSLVTNLTFKVAKAAPAAPVPPGAAGLPLPAVPPPAAAAAAPTAYNPGGRNNVMVAGGAPAPAPPANNPGQPAFGGGANAAFNAGASTVPNAAGGGADGFRSIPSRNIRTTTPQSAQPEMSREQQYLMLEVNRKVTEGIPGLPPLPPTPLNPNPNYPPLPGGIPPIP